MAQLTTNGPSEPPRGLTVDITEDERRSDTRGLRKQREWLRFIVSCLIGFLLPITYHAFVEHVKGLFVFQLSSLQYYAMLFLLGTTGATIASRLLR